MAGVDQVVRPLTELPAGVAAAYADLVGADRAAHPDARTCPQCHRVQTLRIEQAERALLYALRKAYS